MNLNSLLLVGAGGALGSMLRFALAMIPLNKNFPYVTFAINITGSFIIGLLFGLLVKNNISNYWWKFLAPGFCGGFTTFSAFSLEGMQLLQQQRYFSFGLYFLLSIAAGVFAAYLGYTLTK